MGELVEISIHFEAEIYPATVITWREDAPELGAAFRPNATVPRWMIDDYQRARDDLESAEETIAAYVRAERRAGKTEDDDE